MTGIASLPLLSMRDKASARPRTSPASARSAMPRKSPAQVGADGVQCIGAEILRSIGRGVQIKRELRQFLSDHPPVVRAGFGDARRNIRLNPQTFGPAPGQHDEPLGIARVELVRNMRQRQRMGLRELEQARGLAAAFRRWRRPGSRRPARRARPRPRRRSPRRRAGSRELLPRRTCRSRRPRRRAARDRRSANSAASDVLGGFPAPQPAGRRAHSTAASSAPWNR